MKNAKPAPKKKKLLGSRGRPRNMGATFCLFAGCGKRNAPGEKYCCRDHAPFGNYGVNDSGWKTREI